MESDNSFYTYKLNEVNNDTHFLLTVQWAILCGLQKEKHCRYQAFAGSRSYLIHNLEENMLED
jgi:hypothetical protein